MLSLILMSILICVCLFWKSYREKKGRLYVMPPELSKKLPLIGHGHHFVSDNMQLFEVLKWISMDSIEKGGVITMNIGPKLIYVISDPDDCLTIANTCPKKDYQFEFSKSWLGDGLFTGNGEIWRRHRKLLNPAFNRAVLDGFMGTFNDTSRLLVEQLYSKAGRGPFLYTESLLTHSLKIVLQTVFGIAEDDAHLHKEYSESIRQVQAIYTERFMKIWLHINCIYNWTTLKKKEDFHVKILNKMSDNVIRKKKLIFNQNKLSEKDHTVKPDKCKSFIDLILELASTGEMLTEKEMRDEVNTFIVAGHDTCAYVLSFILLLIGSHPNVQERLYGELLEVVGNNDTNVTKSDLAKLFYMEVVIKEVLRMYPPGCITSRYTDIDVKLKNYIIPAGSSIVLMPWSLHYHPVWGLDVNKFRPERWLDQSQLPKKVIFAGFGLGKRNCVGNNFAMMSLKTTLAHILRQYRIIADIAKVNVKIDVLLKPANDSRISLELR